ncbi:MAG: hypothetical protein ACP5OK_07585, partial [Thermoprotei archaeon]
VVSACHDKIPFIPNIYTEYLNFNMTCKDYQFSYQQQIFPNKTTLPKAYPSHYILRFAQWRFT